MLIEEHEPEGPFGAKGIGEIGLVPTAGAVAAALYAFDGQRRTVLPMIDSPAARALSVGLSPDEAKAQGIEIKTSMFPFAANGRAMSLESTDGFVRVVARANDHRILGWQAVGVQVSELSIAFVQSIEMGATLQDIAGTIHAHPTLGEAFPEAAMKALGHALHI